MRKNKPPKKSKKPSSKKPSKSVKEVIAADDDSIGKKTDVLNTGSIEIVPEPAGDAIEDDEVTVYRDIMTMTDDERFSSDDNNGLSTIRLSPPPPPSWDDDPKKIKFTIGQLVVRKGVKDSVTYYVSGPAKRENYYTIIPDKSLKDITVHEEDIKLAPKDAKWTKYWDTIPVIKAPSWNSKETKKDVKNITTRRIKKK